MSLTFFLAVIGWIIFRSENMTQAIDFFGAMVSNKFVDLSAIYGKQYLAFGILLLLVEWIQRNKQHALQFPNSKPFCYRLTRWSIYYAIILIIALCTGASQTFIYFQF